MTNVSGKISKRYAKALFELCKIDELDTVSMQLNKFSALWAEQEGLRKALLNPAYPLKERIAAIRAVAEKEGATDVRVLNLVSVLVENHRTRYAKSIAETFVAMINELRKSLSLTVTSAFPVEGAEKAKLADKLQKEYSGMASVEYKVDPSLIGGITVTAGDKLLDRSLRTALERVRSELVA